jgi:hypothetical protein
MIIILFLILARMFDISKLFVIAASLRLKNHIKKILFYGVLFSHKKLNYFICRKMDRTGDHHIK